MVGISIVSLFVCLKKSEDKVRTVVASNGREKPGRLERVRRVGMAQAQSWWFKRHR
jgi:hypothetical protein